MGSSFLVNYNEGCVYDSFVPGDVGECQKSQGGVEELQVLDGGEGPAISRKKAMLGTKRLRALKSHAEAEKRRRERMNGHLSTLRNFVPCTNKMDKATLLAKVINQLRVLRNKASEATKEMVIPTDVDELTVAPYNDFDRRDEFFTFKASLCCDQKPDLILDIRQAINILELTITKAEISTLRNRLKMVLIITGSKEQIGVHSNLKKFANKIQHALFSVLDKNSALHDYLPKARFPYKQPRV